MTVARLQVSLDRDSMLPADRVVNTYFFKNEGAVTPLTEAEAATLAAAMQDAYTALAPNLGSTLSGTGSIDVYDMADPEPRVPLASGPLGTMALGGSALPAEVALCLSFRGAVVSGIPQARSRGRVFLGPLSSSMAVAGGDGDIRPSAAIMDFIANWGASFNQVVGPGSTTWLHSVFSERSTLLVGGTVGNSTKPVVEYWCDNAFDTQRRRGVLPTTRNVVVV